MATRAKPRRAAAFRFQNSLLWQHTRSNFSNATQTDTRYENPQLERNGVENYRNGEFGPDLIVDYIGEFIEAHKTEPFSFTIPCSCRTRPLSESRFRGLGSRQPGRETRKHGPRYFDDMVRYTDKMVGRVLAQLEASGVAHNTYLVFTTDNGSLGNTVSQIKGRKLRGGKGQTTNAGTHVPLIVSGPGIPPGAVNRNLIDFSDFLPTFCEMAGLEPGTSLETNGVSFLPQLLGKVGTPREFIYC